MIGLFYRETHEDYSYQDSLGGDFDPGVGYDTASSCGRSRKKDEEEEKCIICIETMKRFQQLRALPCAHKFHRRCINGWLRYEQFCPLCKTAVVL